VNDGDSEATVALLAARLVISLGFSSFILEGDSLNVIMALQQPTIIDWRIASTVSITLYHLTNSYLES
jgi:hypothetical protein